MSADGRAALKSARDDAAASVMARRAAEMLRDDVLALASDPRVAMAVSALAEELSAVPGVDRRSRSAP